MFMVIDADGVSTLWQCLKISVSLDHAGAPGVSVSLGLMGEVAFDVCTRCYKWRVTSVLGFEWGVSLFGYGVALYAELEGDLQVQELPCVQATGAEYCEFLDMFLPDDEATQETRGATCHSESPFSVLMTYIALEWRKTKGSLGLDDPNGDTPMQQKLKKITSESPASRR